MLTNRPLKNARPRYDKFKSQVFHGSWKPSFHPDIMCLTNSSYSTCPWLSSKPTKSWSTSSADSLSPRLQSTWRNSAALTNPLQLRSNTRRHSMKYSGSTENKIHESIFKMWITLENPYRDKRNFRLTKTRTRGCYISATESLEREIGY